MTAVQPAPAIETGPPETAADAAKRAATYDKLALQQLLAPTRARSSRAQRYQLLASAATIVPFIGIVEIGRELLAGGPPDTARLWTVVAIVIGALLVRTLAGGAALTITHFADVDLQRSLRLRIVDKLGRLPLGWFGGKSSGEVNKAVQNDVGELHFLVAHSAVENTGALATPLFGLIYCFYLDWRLGLLAMATVPFYIGIYLALGRDSRTQMERLDRGVERISATIVEFIAGVSVVKTFGQAGKAHKRFADAADEFNESFAGWIGPLVRVKAVSSVFIDTPVLLLANLAGGYWFVRSGWVTPIEVLGSTLVAVTIPAAVLTVGYSTHIKRQAAAAAGRLQRLLDTPVLPVAREPAVPQDNSIRFEDVRFSYDGENTVLHDVSLTLPAGTITALVGPSGSGKSTLATLVPRFHDVTAGAVRVGGVDVRDIAPAVLYRHVGFVLQDVQLLGISVADNIRLGRADATDDDVVAAAKAARIHDRILQLPRGYDSVIDEDAHFSGGEAQRVSIARAVLADTPILVLDEATAFADPDSEAQIQEALSRLIAGRTVLVIAHRLGSIVSADNVVVLDQGRVVEQGRHDELIAAGGQYARMWQSYTAGHAREWEVAR
ncbi:ABC transporter ATP-binding protein [Mycolicibacterium novocastrense]|uniref:ABC transporter ATP-binding protein n=1 Tax=Mycolicibacterium novocastrense TaxID=59813 RepID=A0AAW5SVH3_MYCNV|nr:ABC transporter ATP-binding protein [Mycolicibacterium novocastrense]MCV7027526.1 ABC transporter ATP-binding protein [Mycolicibacterium novocastrense]GAT11137.1 ABC-type multidrug transport system, ATPase and permease component [Mycolicibacterium novocastrense]